MEFAPDLLGSVPHLMRRTLVMLTAVGSLSATVFLHAADDLVLSRFGDYLESLRVQAGIPGLAATIVSTTDVMWERPFGQQDVERNIATSMNTPFQLDALTQLLVAAQTLRCVEEGRLSLDDTAGHFDPASADPGATLRQLLTHTTSAADGLHFAYRPERLAPLAAALSACTGDTFGGAMTSLLDRLAMTDSVPGSDGRSWPPPSADPGGVVSDQYTRVLARLATPYTVDANGKASASRYTATALTPASGLISTVRNLGRFDLAVKNGAIVRPETLALAWTAPVDRNGQRLPHGLGWFVQSYNGEPIVWQFGVSANGSSSMILTAPFRGLTLILLANSSGLARPFSLEAGDISVSPFARLFLGIFAR
jgi:CubicO group peptidase (beta-lactamase class C family)